MIFYDNTNLLGLYVRAIFGLATQDLEAQVIVWNTTETLLVMHFMTNSDYKRNMYATVLLHVS